MNGFQQIKTLAERFSVFDSDATAVVTGARFKRIVQFAEMIMRVLKTFPGFHLVGKGVRNVDDVGRFRQGVIDFKVKISGRAVRLYSQISSRL